MRNICLAAILSAVLFAPSECMPVARLEDKSEKEEFRIDVKRVGDDGELTDYRVSVTSGESAPPTMISIHVCCGGTGASRKALDPGGTVSWKVTVFSGGGKAELGCSYTGKRWTARLPGRKPAGVTAESGSLVPDPVLERAIRMEIDVRLKRRGRGKMYEGPLTPQLLADSVKSLAFHNRRADPEYEALLVGGGIRDLRGLEYCVNLEEIIIAGSEIHDLTPLKGLIRLKDLQLPGNRITDLSPLSGLVNLENLSLWGNQIESMAPLSGLSNLKTLYICDNRISSFSIMPPKLEHLYFGGNRARDLRFLLHMPHLRSFLFASREEIENNAFDLRYKDFHGNEFIPTNMREWTVWPLTSNAEVLAGLRRDKSIPDKPPGPWVGNRRYISCSAAKALPPREMFPAPFEEFPAGLYAEVSEISGVQQAGPLPELMKPDVETAAAVTEYVLETGLASRMSDFIGGFTYLSDIFGGRTAVDVHGNPVNPDALNSFSRTVIEANPEVYWEVEIGAAYAAAAEFANVFSGYATRLAEGGFESLQLTDAGKILENLLNEPAIDGGLSLEERAIVQTEALLLSTRNIDPYGLGPPPSHGMTREEIIASRRVRSYNRLHAYEKDLHVNVLGIIDSNEWDEIAAGGGDPYMVAHERRYAESRDFYVDYRYMSGDEWDSIVRAGRNPVQVVAQRREMDRVIKVVSDALGEEAVNMLEENLGLDFEAAQALRNDLLEMGADPGRADEMVRATQMLRVIVHFGQEHTFSDPGAMETIMRFVDSWCKRSQAIDTMSRHLHNNLKDLSERQLELIQRADREGLIEALMVTDDFVDESIVEMVLNYAGDKIKDEVKDSVQKGWWPF